MRSTRTAARTRCDAHLSPRCAPAHPRSCDSALCADATCTPVGFARGECLLNDPENFGSASYAVMCPTATQPAIGVPASSPSATALLPVSIVSAAPAASRAAAPSGAALPAAPAGPAVAPSRAPVVVAPAPVSIASSAPASSHAAAPAGTAGPAAPSGTAVPAAPASPAAAPSGASSAAAPSAHSNASVASAAPSRAPIVAAPLPVSTKSAVPAPSRAAAPSVAAVPSRSSAAAAASPSAAAPLSAPPPPSAVPAAVPLPPRAATPAVLAPSLPLPALLAHPNDFRVTWFWVGGSRAPRERARLARARARARAAHQRPPARSLALAQEPGCTIAPSFPGPGDFTGVVGEIGFCQAVPNSVDSGYIVACDSDVSVARANGALLVPPPLPPFNPTPSPP